MFGCLHYDYANHFALLAMLLAHRAGLQTRIIRLQGLIQTIDSTILHLTGEVNMNEKRLFAGFSEEEEKHYEQEARQKWGEKEVSASN